jgi:membrane protease YdiL (CAAX protease family)
MRRTREIAEPILLFAVFFLPGYLFPSSSGFPDFDSLSFHLRYAFFAAPQVLFILFLMSGKEGGLARFGAVRFRAAVLPRAIALSVVLAVLMGCALLPVSLLSDDLRRLFYASRSFAAPRPAMLAVALATCVLTGYREELFFRSYLLTVFEDLDVGFPKAAAASSLLFAVGHAYEGIAAAIAIFLIGLILARAFRKRRNLHVVAISHALYDFCVLALVSAFALK